MKHYLLSVANGLHTPPCNNSHGKSSHFFNFRFSLFTPLLVLFLLIVGNSPAWGGFTQGTKYYVDLRTVDFYKDGAILLVNFYNGSDYQGDDKRAEVTETGVSHVYSFTIPNITTDNFKIVRLNPSNLSDRWNETIKMYQKDAGSNNCINLTSWPAGNVPCSWTTYIESLPEPEPYTGNLYLIGGACTGQNWDLNNATLLANNGNGIYTITRQINAVTGNSSDGFKFLESANWDPQWRPVPTNATESLSDGGKAQNVTPGQENIVIKKNPGDPDTKWHLTESGTYTITIDLSDKNNGKMSIQAVSNAPHTGDKFYIMGSHNGWSKNSEDHKMTIVDGKYAYKTYENITENWDFKVAKEDGTELGWSYFSQSKSDYTCSEVAAAISNIRPDTYNGAKNLTIYWDGVNVYVKVEDATPTPSGVTYDGSEYFFWNTNVSSWGTVLAGKDRTQFLQFKNTTTNATAHTKLAFLWEQTNTGGNVEGILAAKAPSGEWHQVRHCRVNADDWNEGAILGTGEGSTDWIDLQEGNYMYKESGSIKFTTRTAEHFKFFLSGTVALAGGASEFNPWNGNGTLYTDRITKTLEAGTYKFKINPDMTIYDSRGGVNKWTNEFNMDDLDAANSSDNIDLHDGNNKEIWFDLDKRSEVTIACDGNKVTVVAVPAQQYTVTFTTDGGSTIAPIQVIDGSPVARPADPTKAGYTFVKWQLDGSNYDFSSAVTGNITLNAVWAYKAIESISLNESEHMTWVGNSDFTLTPSYSPSDVITKTVTWSSNNESVATVDNGIVHAVGAGTATITCTVTDMFDNQRSATCEVTVAACEMATDNIYSMTVTGYNISIGHDANLAGLWNESSDNDGPASMTITRFAFKKKDAGTTLYAYDDNGTVKVKEDASGDDVQWLLIPTGETYTPSWNNGNSCQLYYIKNKATGAYMHRGSVGVNTGNSDWFYSVTNTNATNTATDDYKWFFVYENENQRCIYVKSGVEGEKKSSYKLHTSNQYNDCTDAYAAKPMLPVGRTADINDFAKSYNNTNDFNYNTDPNPNYLASLMNGSYYRMKENATVQANLTAPLVSGAVITVRLYADAATTVKLQKTDDTEIETINLTADTEFEYSYTVNNASPLLGESAFVIKAADNHAGIASIVVTRTYAIRLAQLIEETESGGTLTLTCDYATDNAVINKAITINGQGHTIGDLTVEYEGDLTLSSELTVRDFTIWAKAGNTSTPAASGQVRNASKLNVNGNAYFLYTVDPSGEVQYGWYDFTVPFPINIVSGIKGIQEGVLKEDFRNGVDYAVMEYFGDKQAQGQYPYKKFSGVMQPNRLYTITLDDDYNYNTLRMQKTADGALVASESVTLNPYTYTGGDAANANWNGVGNGTLHHADAGISGTIIQVYQSGDRTFLPVEKNNYSLVVGSAFMVQETGTMTLIQANGNKPLLAPSRYESAPATAIQIASEGKPFSDQLFITASETGGQAYTPGVDVAKAGELGSANVPQIWTNAYNSSLCVHEAQLINGKAQYNLSIYAPAAGSYTLTSKNIPADYSLYLTQDGMIVSELSDTYTLDLSKGITTEYGLLLTEIYNSPTGIENTQTDKIQTTKIICNGVLYILHNGKVYNAQGAKVK